MLPRPTYLVSDYFSISFSCSVTCVTSLSPTGNARCTCSCDQFIFRSNLKLLVSPRFVCFLDIRSAPRQLATPEETFAALSTQFDLSEPVKQHILKQGCKTLSDFRFMVSDENEVKTVFIDPIRELDGSRLQTARLRHAWTACKALIDSQQAQSAQPVSIEDEDALLPSDELQNLKAMWFKRYHLKPDPSVTPNDRLISRLVRSLRKQAFEVMDLWTVRSLAHQRTHGQKRRKVAQLCGHPL